MARPYAMNGNGPAKATRWVAFDDLMITACSLQHIGRGEPVARPRRYATIAAECDASDAPMPSIEGGICVARSDAR
jgi:hypothetical protein